MLDLLAQAQPGGWAETIDSLARTPLSRVVLFVLALTAVRVALFPYLTKTPTHKRTGLYPVARFFNETLDAIIYAGVFVFLIIRPFGVQAFRIPSESMLDTLLVNDFIVANKLLYRYSDPRPGDIVVFRPPAYACGPEQIDRDGQVNVDFIKRCIGVPGDVIEIRGGILYRNGQPQTERYRRGDNPYDFKLVAYNGPVERFRGRVIPVMFGRGGQPNFEAPVAKEFAIGALTEGEFQTPAPWADVFKPLDMLSDEERNLMDELTAAPPAKIPPGYFLMIGDNRGGSFDGRSWGLVPRDAIVGRSEIIWLPTSRWQWTR